MNTRKQSTEQQYSEILSEILTEGNTSKDRTGVGTKRIQSTVIHANLQKEFPILIGKKINFQNAFTEIVWMLCGRTDVGWLKKHGVNYCDSWMGEDGTIGAGYGKQFRNFGVNGVEGFDQLNDVVNQLKTNPDSRRALISLWNPNQLKETTLPPCHFIYHFLSYVDEKDNKRYLDLHVTQRSADFFLGVPYNLVMSGIFLTLMAKIVGMQVGSIHQTFNDSHTYLNHKEQCETYLENVNMDKLDLFELLIDSSDSSVVLEPKKSPQLSVCSGFDSIEFETFDDMLEHICLEFEMKQTPLKIDNYISYDFIKADVAV